MKPTHVLAFALSMTAVLGRELGFM